MKDIRNDSATTTESAVDMNSLETNSFDRLKYASEKASEMTGVTLKELVFSTFCDNVEKFMRTTTPEKLYDKFRRVTYEYADYDYICLIVWPRMYEGKIRRQPYGFIMGNLDLGYNHNKPDDLYANFFFDTMTGEMFTKDVGSSGDAHPDIEGQSNPAEDKYSCTGAGFGKHLGFNVNKDDIIEDIAFENYSSRKWEEFEIAIFSVEKDSVPRFALKTFYEDN